MKFMQTLHRLTLASTFLSVVLLQSQDCDILSHLVDRTKQNALKMLIMIQKEGFSSYMEHDRLSEVIPYYHCNS